MYLRPACHRQVSLRVGLLFFFTRRSLFLHTQVCFVAKLLSLAVPPIGGYQNTWQNVLARPIHENRISIITVIMMMIIIIIISKQKNTWQNVLARLQPIHENLISIITVIMIIMIIIIISKQKTTWQNVLARLQPIHENLISKGSDVFSLGVVECVLFMCGKMCSLGVVECVLSMYSKMCSLGVVKCVGHGSDADAVPHNGI